jgi:23S rRNA (cytidine1920-2'-O)/16S rRNA (cytidine1409-2'-O)-methyltransferase
MRFDFFLSNFGYVKSRQKAKTLIEGGFITVDGAIIKKPSFEIDENGEYFIEINDPCPYVSRGGLKLQKILDESGININGKKAIDIGASTGGFTDCLLQHGASLVCAVDSGSNQLDERLKNDNRVISIENYNARDISYQDVGFLADIITVDVSFISQTYIIAPASKLLSIDGIYIGLIKPQFEVGASKIGKGGIVKNSKDRLFAVEKVLSCASLNGLKCIFFTKSPIKGGDGNEEYLAMFSRTGDEVSIDKIKTIFN